MTIAKGRSAANLVPTKSTSTCSIVINSELISIMIVNTTIFSPFDPWEALICPCCHRIELNATIIVEFD